MQVMVIINIEYKEEVYKNSVCLTEFFCLWYFCLFLSYTIKVGASMSSYSIVVSKEHKDLFLMIWNKFESRFDLFKNVYIENFGSELSLKFSIVKNNQITYSSVKAWVADCLVVYYKISYFERNLKLPQNSTIPFKILCKVLAVFDKMQDVKTVLDDLELTEEFNVCSYYSFKMGELRARWQEVCDLFFASLPELIASDAFIDLMRYLLDSNETIIKEVFITISSDFIFIKDNKGSNIIKPIENTKTGAEKAVLELILLSPSNIYIKQNDTGKTLSKDIKILFDNKVVYCT